MWDSLHRTFDIIHGIMFKKELGRQLSLYEYKQQFINRKITELKGHIKKMEERKATKRQWLNLEKIQDQNKREIKEKKYNKIIKQIQDLHLEIDELERKQEQFEFDLPEDIKRLEFYRKIKRRIWLSQIALVDV